MNDPWGLSPRERRMAQLVSEGMQDKEIAADLSMSVSRVKALMMVLLGRMGCDGRVQAAVAWATRGCRCAGARDDRV